MKKLRIFASAILLMVCAVMPAVAQEAQEEQEYEYTFNPHWFLQGQVGAQHTLGEISFIDLTAPNIQLGGGYEFSPSLAARLSVNFWKSRAGISKEFAPDHEDYKWDWNYVAPSLDLMVDLTNLIGGFNPERKVGAGLFAGIGANYTFSNSKAENAKARLVENYKTVYDSNVDVSDEVMEYVEDRRSLFWPFRFGGFFDWHLNDNWAINLELQANTLSDQYNSKKTWNTDWYFNGLVGVKYCFGSTYDKQPKEKMIPESEAANYAPACDPIEKTDTVVVKEPVEVFKPSLYEEIYYEINKDKISGNEKYKIRRIIEFMNENPEATIEISGHADKATGTAEYNKKLSQRRADNVAQALKDAGIEESRITVSYHGSEDNIYQGEDMKLNRVSICTAK